MNSYLCRGLFVCTNGPLGSRDVERPSKRSLGHRYDSPSGEVGCLPIGLSFIKLAASKQTVCSSENVITLSPIANVIALLTNLISASEIPFCHGASADEKIHLRPCLLQTVELISSLDLLQLSLILYWLQQVELRCPSIVSMDSL